MLPIRVKGFSTVSNLEIMYELLIGVSGGIAQLGEHLLCKQGVNGSIPFISTKPVKPAKFSFRDGNER